MEIAILGTGCNKCKTLYERVQNVVGETQSTATVKKIEDITEIMRFGVMSTPAVVIDGTVVMQGGLPKESEIKEWLSKGKPDMKELVKQRYNDLAVLNKESIGCCCNPMAPAAPSKKVFTIMSEDYSQLKGYEPDADLGVGCGLPTQYARIQKGDTVVDLGSGAGNDCFIAREETGETGSVIGIDFAPQMLARARANATKRGFTNVEFLEGDIENMPLPDKTADVVVSNCVLNLLPCKDRIFKEIYRVLKPGGHFCISDVVLNGVFPKEFTDNAAMYAGCIASAIQREEYLGEIEKAGFADIKVERTKTITIPDDVLQEHLDEATIEKYQAGNVGIYSITVTGKRTE
ncbi:arsenite methyltransferase [Massilibacteroides sp.]|uniref:arsenite methyltransferase n=1 Tax=Massilibacteroides sp. TaxID=2034766 RepID=UPI002606C484|nr:arsenite methyltransferase [Massilibacteroides sp.]MDD4515878.1 arsenite methyltransferase [Massilibacteroides sp.]